MTTIGEEEKMGRANAISYLDLLAIVLSHHEKTLSRLIERLDKLSHTLTQISRQTGVRERGKTKLAVEERSTRDHIYIS